jgi:hypothetical protein
MKTLSTVFRYVSTSSELGKGADAQALRNMASAARGTSPKLVLMPVRDVPRRDCGSDCLVFIIVY